MKFSESIKERILTALLSAIATSVIWILSSIYRETAGPFLENVLPAINNKTLLLLCFLLFLVCVSLSIALACEILGNSKNRLKKQYPSDIATGLRYSLKDGTWICPKCFEGETITPLLVQQHKNCEKPFTQFHCTAYMCSFYLFPMCEMTDKKQI